MYGDISIYPPVTDLDAASSILLPFTISIPEYFEAIMLYLSTSQWCWFREKLTPNHYARCYGPPRNLLFYVAIFEPGDKFYKVSGTAIIQPLLHPQKFIWPQSLLHAWLPSVGVFCEKKSDTNGHLLGFVPHTYFFLFDPFTNIFTLFRNILLIESLFSIMYT